MIKCLRSCAISVFAFFMFTSLALSEKPSEFSDTELNAINLGSADKLIKSLAGVLSSRLAPPDLQRALIKFKTPDSGADYASAPRLIRSLPLSAGTIVRNTKRLDLASDLKTLNLVKTNIVRSALISASQTKDLGNETGTALASAGPGTAAALASVAGLALLYSKNALEEDTSCKGQTVTLSASSSTIAENGGSSITLTATLTGTESADVTVAFSVSGTATSGTDYAALSSITISAGSTTGTTTFTPTDDSVYEGNETAIIDISTVTGNESCESGTQQVTLTITENEIAPLVTLAAGASSIAENSGSSITLTGTLTGATSEDVTVAFSVAGTGTSGTDYAALSSITISAGTTTGTTTFTPTDDSVYEGNETAIIDISTVSGGSVLESGVQQVTLTITEDDSAPTVTLSAGASSITEDSGSSITLTATLSNATTADVTVAFSVAGTGTSGTDYTALSSITVSAGSTTGTTTFTPTDDSVYEGDETAIIDISSVSGGSATESGTQQVTLTITENESAPTVSLSVSTSSIAENSSSSITLTATLSVATTADVTVAFSVAGTATSGTDYTALSSITVSAGSTTGTTTFTPTDDSGVEGDETAVINISSVSGGSATESGTQQVTLTITDDESTATVSLSASATSIAENSGGSITLTATLSVADSADVTVAFSVAGTGTSGTDYTALSSITISAGSTTGTTTFTPTDDSVYEGNETAIIDISSVSGGSATESGTQQVTLTITEDDSAPTVTLAAGASSIAENSGSSITLTATLSSATTSTVTVAFSVAGTGTSGTDYTALSSITVAAGSTTGTTTFTPTDDSVYEGDETAVIDINSVTNGSESGTQQVTLTITENESVPTVTLAAGASSITENSGSAITLTATLSGTTTSTVTVAFSVAGTATSGTDYTALSSITVSAGSTTGTTTFTPTNDSSSEGNETAVIDISSVTNATESGTQQVTLTITDDESTPTVSLSASATSIAENSGSSITLTATLSVAASADVTVAFSVAGTGTSGTDYTALSSITVSTGSTTGTTTFTPTDDSVNESDETAVIDISSVSGGSAAESGTQQVTLTITDDESTPTVSLSASTSSIAENSGSSITLTATLSGSTTNTVTVAFSVAGTATSGTDYTALSSITVSAGSTTGTTSFTPTSDTSDEGGSETAIIDISSVTNATESGTQQVTLTITEKALNSGTPYTYSASLAAAWKADAEFTNIQAFGDSYGTPNSFETINLHKAWGYGRYGSGKLIAFVDSNFDLTEAGSNYDHIDLNGKTVTAYGNFTAPDTSWVDRNSLNHGTAVVGIAAGESDGVGIVGVAPLASIHISDWTQKDGETYTAAKLAKATDHAKAAGAIVQNNSWGTNTTVAYFNALAADNPSFSNYQVAAHLLDGTTAGGSAFEDWVTALDNFQKTGVIVNSLSNRYENTDASWLSGLPAIFTDLDEAWISVVNIDRTGSAGSYTNTRISAPCGAAAKFCLGGDGENITVAATTLGGASSYYTWHGGTSFAAPMVSGAVALLSDHFPNHTPEKLVDRLLASGDNSWYTHSASVEFGNGVLHGYDTEFGHGMMDIYAALQPITSDSYTAQMYAGSRNLGGSSFALELSNLLVSQSFGDAIKRALTGENGYFYDALDGGFAYDLSGHVSKLAANKPSIDLNRELGGMRHVKADRVAFEKSQLSDKINSPGRYFNLTNTNQPAAMDSFFRFDHFGISNLGEYALPFLNSVRGGNGANLRFSLGDTYLTSSFSSSPSSNDPHDKGIAQTLYSFAMEAPLNDNLNYGAFFSVADENSRFLGMQGTGAFNLNGSHNQTNTLGASLSAKVDDKNSLDLVATLSNSKFTHGSEGVITGIKDAVSDSYAASYNRYGLLAEDHLTLAVSQPHRVQSGSMGLRIAGLANKDGSIPYVNKSVDLEPSGRQLDFAVGYGIDVGSNTTMTSKFIHTKDPNHVADAESENSIMLGFKYDNLHLGSLYNVTNKNFDAQMTYSLKY
jgi:hypothetical protein